MRARIRTVVTVGSAAALVMALGFGASPVLASARSGEAPGAPGAASDWVTGDKDGFGTARGTGSKVWYTLNNGELSEIYYPRIDTPSTRDTQLVVTDGRTFTDRESTDTIHRVRLLDPESLSYQQVNTARSGKYVITKTYVTDPRRSTVLVDIEFRSLTGQRYRVYVLHDPALSMTGDDDTGSTQSGALVAADGTNSDAVLASSGFSKTSSGYQGQSDGWTDLASDHQMDWTYTAGQPGNVVQTGQTALTGLAGGQHLTLAIGFATSTSAAVSVARASLASRFAGTQRAYAAGWHQYLATLNPVPRSAAQSATEYHVSQMVLAASEDKTYRGGFVAAPGRPWAWANVLQSLPVYHAVWSRDLYEIATALIAMGDRAAANRALDYLFNVQQRPDGSYPQNSRLSGEAVFGGLQMDEVSFPTVLAGQLGRTGAADWEHIRKAEDFVIANGPSTPGERWENASGYSRPRSPPRSRAWWSEPASPARTATMPAQATTCRSPIHGSRRVGWNARLRPGRFRSPCSAGVTDLPPSTLPPSYGCTKRLPRRPRMAARTTVPGISAQDGAWWTRRSAPLRPRPRNGPRRAA